MSAEKLGVVAGALLTLSLAGPAAAETIAASRPIVMAQAATPAPAAPAATEAEKKKRDAEQHRKGPPPGKAQSQPSAQHPQAKAPPRPAAPPPLKPAPPPAQAKSVPPPMPPAARAPFASPPASTRASPALPTPPGKDAGRIPPGFAKQPPAAATGGVAPPRPATGIPSSAGGQLPPVGGFKRPLPGAKVETPAGQTPAVAPGQPSAPAGARPGTGVGAAAAGAAGAAAVIGGAAAIAGQRAPQGGPAAGGAAPRFDELKRDRRERTEGGRTIIQEGNRTIVRQDNRVFIQNDDGARFAALRGAQVNRRPDGLRETFYTRPDGARIVSEHDSNGRLLRRYRRGPDGRERNLIDNRNFWRNAAIGVGVGAVAAAIAINLSRPTVTIPRHHYIVDYNRASDDELYAALTAPPIERLGRPYSLEEIRYSPELRDRMRRVDLDTITFDSGAYEVGPEQYPKLERLARAILRALRDDPDEVFMIEGHTDAVGADIDNLSLSDRRAESVAGILTETFGVPPENLVTQGYGEQYPKIETAGPERANRRVAVRRITPLMAER